MEILIAFVIFESFSTESLSCPSGTTNFSYLSCAFTMAEVARAGLCLL